MAPKLPTSVLTRPCTLTASWSTTATSTSSTTTTATNPSSLRTHQLRHATFVPRSRRPYTFTQLVQLSDGSTYTSRTTSPLALFKSTKDTRNHALWQPSDSSLRNVEVDEAGKLAGFRARFGRGWDLDDAAGEGQEGAEDAKAAGDKAATAAPTKSQGGGGGLMDHDSFADLISGYAVQEDAGKKVGLSAKEQAKADKKKKK